MKQSALKNIKFRKQVFKSSISIVVALIVLTMTTSGSAFHSPDARISENTTAQESQQTDVRELKPDAPIERELAGVGVHTYKVTLSAGQFLKAVVDQKGIDVVVRLFGPDGKQLTEVDSPNGTQGPEPVSVIAESTGEHHLKIESLDKKAVPGRYEVKIEELHEATARDRDSLTAKKTFAEARQLQAEGTAELRRKAIKKFEEALPLWRKVGDRYGEANTLSEIALIYSQLSEHQKALECYGQALLLYRAAENRQYQARVLNGIGDVYFQMGEKKALEYYNQALPLTRVVGDRHEEAAVLSNFGRVYFKLGEPRRALEYYDQSLSLGRELGDQWREAIALVSIGAVYDSLGELQKALEYYGRALPLQRLIGDRHEEGIVLNNIGAAYAKLADLPKALEYYGQSLALARVTGNRNSESSTLDNMGHVYERLSEPQKALQSFDQALEIKRAIANRAGQATTLHNIGTTYLSLGEPHRALDYFEQALSIRREVGDRRGEASVLDSVGSVYIRFRDLRKALDYHNQSLSLWRAVGDRSGEGSALANIGNVYGELGELQKAREYFDQSLQLRRTVGDRAGEAVTLHYIGSTYSKLGEADKALEYYTQALALSRAVGFRREEAAVLISAGRVERDRGNLVEARRQIEAALNIIESTRAKVASQGLRSSYLASKQDYYTLYINLLMQMHRSQPSSGYDVAALQASERARARSLLDVLTESRADIRQGVDPLLLDRERSLQQQLNASSERLTRWLAGKHTEEQQTTARKEVEALLTAYQDVQAQIRAKSPRYAALTQPQPLSLKEIQQLLDKDTLLLEYALGEERSFLWAVTPTSIKSFELSQRSEIETAARRVYDLLVSKTDTLHPEALTTLSQMLLAPVADQLGGKRLLIVGQGALQYVPFGALPEPSATRARLRAKNSEINKHTSSQPLVVNHEIVTLPSVSVISVLRRELSKPRTVLNKVVVVADPVFAKEDPRVKLRIEGELVKGKEGAKQNGNGHSSRSTDVERSASDLGLTSFERLPLSRSEADLITSLVPKAQSLKALDFAANRATATSLELGGYQIVHFATHSLLNNQHPELSGIVLSLVDEQGQPQDGFLRLHEIYNLKLEADLVVLSACQTALGKEIKGEGLVGLTRGFMYAGTPRVVASLWKVGDRATAELMKRFYQKMLRDGLRPAAALRAAQVSMLKEKQWAAPYQWAGFVLQGEWR